MNKEQFNRLAWDYLSIDTGEKPVLFDLSLLPEIPERKMRIYHNTKVDNIESILSVGLLSGAKVGKRESLPFILASDNKNDLFSSGVFIVADIDPIHCHKVNSSWVEIYQDITPEQITAVYVNNITLPNEQVIKIYRAMGEI
jgi:hypothetical protein